MGPRGSPVAAGRLGHAFAFFVKGSGTLVGGATVSVHNTGLPSPARSLCLRSQRPMVHSGTDPRNYSFNASWRPDCGNDFIGASFEGESAVPEPGGIIAVVTGVIGLSDTHDADSPFQRDRYGKSRRIHASGGSHI